MGQTREPERMTPLRRYLRERGMTLQEAAQKCGVTIKTMEIVAGGSPTLPCLAIQIGSGLGLTQEQVKPLGKQLDASAWGKNGLPEANAIDVDREWWKQLRGGRRTARAQKDVYLDIRALLEHLIAQDKDIACLRPELGEYTLNGINALKAETRRKWISRLEEAMGARQGAFETWKRPKGVHNIYFQADYAKICRLMERPGYDHEALAMRLYPTPTGVETLLDNLWRIERGDTFSLNKARRWADALGVELKEIGEKCIKIY